MGKGIKKILTLLLLVVSTCTYGQFNMDGAALGFHSTSTMQMSGSHYSSTPMVNSNGIGVLNETQESSSIPMIRKTGTPFTPGEGGIQQPIGDVPVIGLICFICIYLFHKRKNG